MRPSSLAMSFSALSLAVAACHPPAFTRFAATPAEACAGDLVTLEWKADNSIHVTLQAPGIDPHAVLPVHGSQQFSMGSGALTLGGIAVNAAQTAVASTTVAIYSGDAGLRLSGAVSCNATMLIQTIDFTPRDGLPAALVVDRVDPPSGRTGTITHNGRVGAFGGAAPPLTTFDGDSIYGTWSITYALAPDERCMGGTAGEPLPVPVLATVYGRCPTEATPVEPTLATTCGHVMQSCCPTLTPCFGGSTCVAGACQAPARTCGDNPIGPRSAVYRFEIVNSAGCASGATLDVVANSRDEAVACVANAGVTAELGSDVAMHRWRRRDGSGCDSGTFSSTDGATSQCASSLCGCSAPEIDAGDCD